MLAARAKGAPWLASPGGFPDQQPDGFDLGGHVGQLEGDRLVAGDRFAERVALQRVLERVLVRGAGDAQRTGADARAGRLERLQHADAAAAALAAEQVLGRARSSPRG